MSIGDGVFSDPTFASLEARIEADRGAWRNADGPCEADDATQVELVEFTADGAELARTYACLDGPA